MGWSAFRTTGPTVAIAATTTGAAGVQVPSSPGEISEINYILSNGTAQPVFVSVSPLSATVAVAPVAGVPQTGFYLGPNSAQSITAGANTYFSVVTLASTSTVYISPGDGL